MRIQPVIYRAHSTVPSRWLTRCEPASVVISLDSSAALIPSSSSLSLSSSHCELLRVILLQGELSPERAHLAHTLCDSLTLCLSLSLCPLSLWCCILLAWPGQKVCALSEQCSVQIVTLTRALARLKLNLDFAFIFRSTTTTATTTAETGKQRNCLRAKKDK